MTFENIRMETDESDAIALKRWVRFLGDKITEVKNRLTGKERQYGTYNGRKT